MCANLAYLAEIIIIIIIMALMLIWKVDMKTFALPGTNYEFYRNKNSIWKGNPNWEIQEIFCFMP
jgi:hypothetical protein